MVGLRPLWVEMVRSWGVGDLVQGVCLPYKEVNKSSLYWDCGWFGWFGDLVLISRLYEGLWEDLPYERNSELEWYSNWIVCFWDV